MKIVIAMDSFKGSLTSLEAGCAVADGIRRAAPDAELEVLPLADGGEGTVAALCSDDRGELVKIPVSSPTGDTVIAEYGILSGGTAVIEIAEASGLFLVSPERRDPMTVSTRGVGELILDALDRGSRSFIVGIGGSATNDGGTGMLRALGYRFLDVDGCDIPEGCAALSSLASISCENADARLAECSFKVACDVTNPLLGELGCSAVFAPQKGAKADNIPTMDHALGVLAAVTKKCVCDSADPEFPGVGAAGGLGYAFKYYLGATLEAGCPLILKETGALSQIEKADVVITGEGRLDAQSLMGKLPTSVAQAAARFDVPVIAVGGSVSDDVALNDGGLAAYFPIVHAPCTLDFAMERERAQQNLRRTAEQIMRLWLVGAAYARKNL